MKLHTPIFTYLILLISFQNCFAQEKQKAVLITEFGKPNCELISAGIDQLMTGVNNTPNSTGYILMNGNKAAPFQKYVIKSLLKTYLLLRKFDLNKIIFLSGKDEESDITRFYLVPFGADKPEFIEQDWNYKLPPIIKPFIVHADSWNSEVCPDPFSFKFYSQFLLANPNLRGHVVIYEKSATGFHQIKEKLRRNLVNTNKIPRHQLKFFYVKRRAPDVEFWYSPKQMSRLKKDFL